MNDRDNTAVRLIFAVLVFAAAFVEWNGGSVDDLYPLAVRYFYMPLFVIFRTFLFAGSGGKHGDVLVVLRC